MKWTLQLGRTTVTVPRRIADPDNPSVRLLPSEIFGLLGAPITSPHDRVVTVTASSGSGVDLDRRDVQGPAVGDDDARGPTVVRSGLPVR